MLPIQFRSFAGYPLGMTIDTKWPISFAHPSPFLCSFDVISSVLSLPTLADSNILVKPA